MYFLLPSLQARRKVRRTFFPKLNTKKWIVQFVYVENEVVLGHRKSFFSPIVPPLCFIRKRRNSQTGLACCYVTALLAIAGRAEVKAPKQTFSEKFLFMKGSTLCAASPQCSSLLVTFQKMCWWRPYSSFLYRLGGSDACTSSGGKLVGWWFPCWVWHLDFSCFWPNGLKAYYRAEIAIIPRRCSVWLFLNVGPVTWVHS